MKFLYEGNSRKSGIYEIVNKITGFSYVGSAQQFKKRWSEHRYSLTVNKHINKHFQKSFTKHLIELGHDDFLEFNIIQVMEGSTKPERLCAEENWINIRINEGKQLYNCNLTPTKEPTKSPERQYGKRNSPDTEYKPGNIPWTKDHGHDEETKKFLGEKSKDMWNNPEIRKKLEASRTSEKFRNSTSNNIKKLWQDPVYKEARVASMNTVESKKSRSEKTKSQWEATREKMIASHHTEKFRNKSSASHLGNNPIAAECLSNSEWLREQYILLNVSVSDISKKLSVRPSTVYRWIKRHNIIKCP